MDVVFLNSRCLVKHYTTLMGETWAFLLEMAAVRDYKPWFCWVYVSAALIEMVDGLAAVVLGTEWGKHGGMKGPQDYPTVCWHPDGTTVPTPTHFWLT